MRRRQKALSWLHLKTQIPLVREQAVKRSLLENEDAETAGNTAKPLLADPAPGMCEWAAAWALRSTVDLQSRAAREPNC